MNAALNRSKLTPPSPSRAARNSAAHRLDRRRDVAAQQVGEAHHAVDQRGGTPRDRPESLRAATQQSGIRRVARAPGGLGQDRDGKVRLGREHRGGGLERDPGRLGRRGSFVRHLGANPAGLCHLTGLVGQLGAGGRQPDGPVELAGVVRRPRGSDQPPAADGRCAGQLGRPVEGPRRRRRRATARRPLGDLLQTVRSRVVRPAGGRRDVPGAPVGVARIGQHPGERPVRGDPTGEGRLLVGRRPDQGMPEDHAVGGHVDEPAPLGRLEVARVAAELRGGGDEGRQGGAVVGRGQQQDRPGRLPEGAHLPAEVLLEPSRCRQRRDRRRDRGRRGRMGRQLDDGERIAPGLRDDAVGDVAGQAPHGGGETSGVGGTQPREREALHPGRGERGVTVPGGEDGRDRVGVQAADGEEQGVDRRLVEPLGIVEQAQERPVAGDLGEQRQRRRTRQHPLDRGTARSERGPEGLRLRAG